MLTTQHQRLTALRPLSPESGTVLDCGSLLPLSATQPAASRRGQQAGSRKAAAGCTQSTVFNSRPRINSLTSRMDRQTIMAALENNLEDRRQQT